MKRTRNLAPFTGAGRLSLLLAAAALLLGIGLFTGQRAVEATATSVTLSATSALVGGAVTVTAVYTDDTPITQASAVLTSTNPAIGVFATPAFTANSDGQTTTGVGTSSLTITSDADTTAEPTTFTVSFTCTASGTTTIALTEGLVTVASSTLTCGAAATTMIVTASPSVITVCGGTSTITATGVASSANVTFATSVGTFQGTGTSSQTVASAGGLATVVYVSPLVSLSTVASITATSATGQSGFTTVTLTCLTAATPIGSLAGQITVSAAPSTINTCSGSAFVTAVVKTAAGANVADGTIVTFNANVGTVSPNTATTINGGVLAVYTAPSTGGTATVTATSGPVSGNTQLVINCAAAPAPAPPPPPAPAPPPITAPSTGDAGLLERGSTPLFVGFALLAAAVVAGAIAAVRQRA